MLRNNINHLGTTLSWYKSIILGNLKSDNLDWNYNTYTIWFDISNKYNTRFIIDINLSTVYWHKDSHGTTRFRFLVSLSEYDPIDYPNPYSYIECLETATNIEYFTEIIFQPDKNLIGIKFVYLVNDGRTWLYTTIGTSDINMVFTSRYKIVKEEYSVTDNWRDLPNIAHSNTRITYNVNKSIVWLCKDINKTFILSGCCENFTNKKSIAIPKWVNSIDIVGSNNGAGENYNTVDNPKSPVVIPVFSFTTSKYNYRPLETTLIMDIELGSVQFDNEFIKDITNTKRELWYEGILVFDGDDSYCSYYHISHKASTAISNNYIRIIGSVKKKFRVLCHKIHKILNYIHNFNHIKSFPYKNYEIGGDLIC